MRHRHRARQALFALAVGAAGLVGVTGAPAGAEVVGGVDFGQISPGPDDVLVGATPGATVLQLTLGLRRDQSGLEAFARAVSDPTSPEYGQYLSVAELASRFGVEAEGLARDRRLLLGPRRRLRPRRHRRVRPRAHERRARRRTSSASGSTRTTIPMTQGGPYTAIFPDGMPSLPAELAPGSTSCAGSASSACSLRAAMPTTTGGRGPRAAPGGGGNPNETGTTGRVSRGDRLRAGRAARVHAEPVRAAYGSTAARRRRRGSGVRVAVAGDGTVAPSDLTVFAECFALASPPFFVTNPANLPLPPTSSSPVTCRRSPRWRRASHASTGRRAAYRPRELRPHLLHLARGRPARRRQHRRRRSPTSISISMGLCEQAWQQQGELTGLMEFVLATGVGGGHELVLPGRRHRLLGLPGHSLRRRPERACPPTTRRRRHG